jgi:hypothetical protein
MQAKPRENMKHDQNRRENCSKNASGSLRPPSPIFAWLEIRRSILAKLSHRILKSPESVMDENRRYGFRGAPLCSFHVEGEF